MKVINSNNSSSISYSLPTKSLGVCDPQADIGISIGELLVISSEDGLIENPLEPVEKILILSGFIVAGSVVHKYRWGAFFTFLEFFVEFLSGFMMGLTRNVTLATAIINSSAVMAFSRICVLCLVTGAILRKEEEDGIYKHGMLLIGIYGISAGNVIVTVLSYSFTILEKLVSILSPLYLLTFAGVILYGIYLGRSYLFFERIVEDGESSLDEINGTSNL